MKRLILILVMASGVIGLPLTADEARVVVAPGINLVSIPLSPTSPWTARDLARAAGSPIVARAAATAAAPGRFETFIEGLGKPPFVLEAGQAYVVLASKEGSVLVTGTPWPSQFARQSVTRGLNGLALTTAPGQLDSTLLVDRVRANFIVRSVLDSTGRGRLEAVLPELNPASFPLLPGRGYLLFAPATGDITLHEPLVDRSAPALRILAPLTGQQAISGSNIEVVAEATDESGIEHIEFFHGTASARPTTPPFTATFSLSGLPSATSLFLVRAVDRMGNVTTREVSVTVLAPVRSATVHGLVQEANSRRAIRDVTVSIAGSQRTSRTNNLGEFRFEDAPQGDQSLLIDGATGEGGPYAGYTLELRVLPAIDNPVLRPVFLPRIDRSSFDLASTTRTARVVSAPALAGPTLPGISLIVPAGATVDRSGRPFTGNLSLTEVPAEFTPSALPEGIRPGLVSTLQPAGVLFNRPLPISYPNIDRLPRGSRADIYQVNHATGRFEVIGTGTVSADGRTIVSDGAILTSASWHAAAPPPPPQAKLYGTDKMKGCPFPIDVGGGTLAADTGDFSDTISLPSFEILGKPIAPTFVYRTANVSGRVPLAIELDYSSSRPPPVLAIIRRVSAFGPEQRYAYTKIEQARLRFGFVLDGSKLTNGSYPVEFEIQGDYQFLGDDGRPIGSTVSRIIRESVTVRNEPASAFGSGWQLAGLDTVRRSSSGPENLSKSETIRRVGEATGSCGEVLLESGSGESSRFIPVLQAITEISRVGEKDLFRFPASFGDQVSIRVDRLGDGEDGTSTLDPAVEVSTSTGVVIARDDDSGSNLPTGPGKNAQVRNLELKASDVYTVAIIGSSGTRGRYRLSVSGVRRSRLVTSVPSEGITTLEPAFVFTDAILASGVERTYPLTASARQIVDIRMSRLDPGTPTSGLNPRLELRGPRGTIVAADDDGGLPNGGSSSASGTLPGGYFDTGAVVPDGPGRNARIARVVLAEAGNYVIAAQGAGGTVGRYKLTLFFETVPGSIAIAGTGPVETKAGFLGPEGDPNEVEEDGFTCGIRVKSPDGTVSRFDSQGVLSARISRVGESTHYQYEGGLLRSITFPGSVAGLEGAVGSGAPTLRFDYAGGKLAAVTDPMGRTTRFSVDRRGDLERLQFPDGSRRSYQYGADHLLKAQTFEDGSVEELGYNELGQVVSITNNGFARRFTPGASVATTELGAGTRGPSARPMPTTSVVSTLVGPGDRKEIFVLDGDRHLIERIDPLKRSTRNSYDGEGRLIKLVRPSGRAFSFEYTPRGSVTMFRDDTTGATWRTDYDSTDRPVRLIDPLGRVTQLTNDLFGNLRSVQDSIGNVTLFSVNGRGLTTAVTDALGSLTRLEYDGLGNLSATIDPLGNRIEIRRNAAGDITSLTRPGGRVVRATYTQRGLVASVTDEAGRVSEFGYDSRARLITVKQPAGGTSSILYSTRSRPVALTNSLGHRTELAYDSANNLTGITDPESRVVRAEYDAAGQLLATVAPDGIRTEYAYDLDGRRTREVRAAGTGLAQTTEHEYDTLDRLLSSTRAKGLPDEDRVSLTYDAAGHLLTLADGGGKKWKFESDPLGRITRVLDPLGRASSSDFDAVGRLTRSVLVSGAVIRRYYDRMSRLTRAEFIRTNGSLENSVALGYDVAGNLETVADSSGSVSISYDLTDRPVRLAVGALGKVLTLGYDEAGRPASQGVEGDPASGTAYSHDLAGRLTEISSPAGTARLSLDRTGLLSKVELPNGVVRDFVYDSAARLIQHSARIGAAQLAFEEGFQYDALSRLTNRMVGGRTESYRYDARNRLVRAEYGDGRFEQFGYDASDNRTEHTTSGGTTRFFSDATGRLLRSETPSSETNNFGYTLDGQLSFISRAGVAAPTRFGWDIAGRLLSVEATPGETETFRYHPPLGPFANLRIESSSPKGTERHLWGTDGNLLADLTTAGAVTRRYLTGGALDQQFAVRELGSGTTRALVQDYLGSVVGTVDSTGAFAGPARYLAFGSRASPAAAGAGRLGYTGREQAQGGALVYVRNRYYSPELGRWMSKDPIGFAGGLNLYAYVNGDPINRRDPLGLAANQALFGDFLGKNLIDLEAELADTFQSWNLWYAKRAQENFDSGNYLAGVVDVLGLGLLPDDDTQARKQAITSALFGGTVKALGGACTAISSIGGMKLGSSSFRVVNGVFEMTVGSIENLAAKRTFMSFGNALREIEQLALSLGANQVKLTGLAILSGGGFDRSASSLRKIFKRFGFNIESATQAELSITKQLK